MCRLRNIAMRDYQESVTTGQTDTHTDRQTPDKVIPMCRYALQVKQLTMYKVVLFHPLPSISRVELWLFNIRAETLSLKRPI